MMNNPSYYTVCTIRQIQPLWGRDIAWVLASTAIHGQISVTLCVSVCVCVLPAGISPSDVTACYSSRFGKKKFHFKWGFETLWFLESEVREQLKLSRGGSTRGNADRRPGITQRCFCAGALQLDLYLTTNVICSSVRDSFRAIEMKGVGLLERRGANFVSCFYPAAETFERTYRRCRCTLDMISRYLLHMNFWNWPCCYSDAFLHCCVFFFFEECGSK